MPFLLTSDKLAVRRGLPQVVTDASVFNPKGDMGAKVECEGLLHRCGPIPAVR